MRDIIIGPVDISARTQDGIKIEAKDVRMSVSINRSSSEKNKKLTSLKSYPFWEDAILGLIYQQSNPISQNKAKGSTSFKLKNSMDGKFKGELKNFINKHQLSHFISTEGNPEKKEYRTREEEFDKMHKNFLSEKEVKKKVAEKEAKKGIEFQTRDKISRLFTKFSQDFNEKDSQGSAVLNWMGIGVWKTPKGIILEQHLEAWELSKENAKKGSAKALDKIENNEKNEETLRQIQKVPLSSPKSQNSTTSKKKVDLRDLYSDASIWNMLSKTSQASSSKHIESPPSNEILCAILKDYLGLIKRAKVYIPKYINEDEREKADSFFSRAIRIINTNLEKKETQKFHSPTPTTTPEASG